MRVVFMGTPDFAVPCLQALLDAGHTVCGVYTQPDKPKGRKFTLTPPPVKVLAQKAGLSVFQPVSLRTADETEKLRCLQPEVVVVVAYGKLLPKEILAVPPKGCINVHASLLPAYRGAAPIQWSVLNGEKETGVTTMYMAEGLDTGDILLQEKTAIGPQETAGQLHDRLSQMGAELLVRTLDELDSLQPRPQGETTTAYASMLDKSLSPIDWNKPAQQIHDQICGLNPWPAAATTYEGMRLKIFASCVVSPEPAAAKPGSVSGQFVVACGGGTALQITEVQPAGKKRMAASDFLRGHPVPKGAVLPF
ncbi:MAG: methionyl-tRNA formyltransferase [Oscillospiraceae bacterium]|nr:methionyl-tRNA formyltransferase [Oscillospiraceae bacterium]